MSSSGEHSGMDPVERLRALSGAAPPDEAERRMIRGALERADQPSTLARPWLVWPAVALAAAAGLALLLLRTPRPEKLSPIAAPQQQLRETRQAPETVAVGPHRVELAARSRLRLTRSDPRQVRAVLERGRARFAVQRLDGGSFEVESNGILVQVVGTRFTVETTADCTQVEVSEGRVSVSDGQHAVLLTRGDERLFCSRVVSSSASALPGEAMMREAMTLAGRGELAPLVRLLESYLSRYPGGVFEEDALFHLCLARARLGQRERAAELARTFERRFPQSRRAERLRDLLGEGGP